MALQMVAQHAHEAMGVAEVFAIAVGVQNHALRRAMKRQPNVHKTMDM